MVQVGKMWGKMVMCGAKMDMGERREEQEPKTYKQTKKNARGACCWNGEMRNYEMEKNRKGKRKKRKE